MSEALGVVPQRASVSFVGVEPIEVLRFYSGEVVTYLSLGMSRRPMTASDELVLAASGPRAELVIQLRDDSSEIWKRLAVLAAAPVVEGVVYAQGMTVDLGTALGAGSRCTGGLIVNSAIPAVATAAGPVDLLRVLPATSTELAWARVRGSDALLARWDERGTDLLELGRLPVALN